MNYNVADGFDLVFQLIAAFLNSLKSWYISSTTTMYQLLLGFIVTMILLNFFKILINHGSLTGGENNGKSND